MVAFSHLSMIAFVILGLSMVRLMINYSSLLAKNYNDDPNDDVFFYHKFVIQKNNRNFSRNTNYHKEMNFKIIG